MTKREVMIRIETVRQELADSLFEDGVADEDAEELDAGAAGDFEPSEMLMEGRLITGKERVELVYAESELTGMEGSVTTIGFSRAEPMLVSMMRTGIVNTAMVFEAGRRHICLYNTPFSQFEICVHTVKVENRLLRDGFLLLDYLIEVHGARAERCKMTVTLSPCANEDSLFASSIPEKKETIE